MCVCVCVCVCVKKCVIDIRFRVQTLEEAVCISYIAYTIWKDMNLTILPSAMSN